MQKCTVCKEEKSLEEFSSGQRMKNGKRSWCRICTNKYAISYYHKNSERLNKLRQTRRMKDYGRAYHLKRTFGISLDGYEQLLKDQDGKCAICDKTPEEEGKALAIDHSHETGKIRGLLCFSCNAGVIRYSSPDLLRKAALYLEKGV